ncbi:hypothetical protein Ctob_007215 [Chrysochromulina tobinii]|uniref:Uncharacterized protein n=1 Tax=Chrysochromulina tobinii TaxID=1460289 RepID=A0A0M0JM69_9EUKA|nr:hypothetical protein Ctob_007215 [Chrysochromulina tobinii]|eukprot:KOO27674.1 hypothetical protein Ctob_007215 [Chrysochromulina sp. CCMP291]
MIARRSSSRTMASSYFHAADFFTLASSIDPIRKAATRAPPLGLIIGLIIGGFDIGGFVIGGFVSGGHRAHPRDAAVQHAAPETAQPAYLPVNVGPVAQRTDERCPEHAHHPPPLERARRAERQSPMLEPPPHLLQPPPLSKVLQPALEAARKAPAHASE